jgi:hypothetical protein
MAHSEKERAKKVASRTPKKPTKQTQKMIDPGRALALEQAFAASQLLEEKTFRKVKALLADPNEEVSFKEFIRICEEHNISVQLANPLWKSMKTMSTNRYWP